MGVVDMNVWTPGVSPNRILQTVEPVSYGRDWRPYGTATSTTVFLLVEIDGAWEKRAVRDVIKTAKGGVGRDEDGNQVEFSDLQVVGYMNIW